MRTTAAAASIALLCACSSAPKTTHIVAPTSVAAGEYAVRLASCNNCHTAGWIQSGGTLPTSKWLTGSSVGFRGSWGVVYPTNLRLLAPSMSRTEWVSLFENPPSLPLMPFEDYKHGAVSSTDTGAIYDFIVSLGKAGTPVPKDLPPGQTPTTPYINYVVITPAPKPR